MIKIFLDTADLKEIERWNKDSLISGLTANPSLALKAGIKDYRQFMKAVLDIVGDKPVSFEVLADEKEEIERQAKEIGQLGKNVYVKVPLKNSNGYYNFGTISFLGKILKLNVTAVMTYRHAKWLVDVLTWGENDPHGSDPHIISIFAGRVADCGYDPEPIFKRSKRYRGKDKKFQLLWASSREIFNTYQADRSGADIITCTPSLLEKFIQLRNKNLDDYATETSKMFFEDSIKSGMSL